MSDTIQDHIEAINACIQDTPIKLYAVTIMLGDRAKTIQLLTTSADQARISTCTELLPHMAWRNGDIIIVKPLACATDSGRWKYHNKTWIAI